MPSYHVTYRESKKVISVSDKTEIVRHIKDIFGIQALVKDIQLQLYDVEWEDFVDVDCDVLPERGKLNVYVRRSERKDACVCRGLNHQSLLNCLSPFVIGSSLPPTGLQSKDLGIFSSCSSTSYSTSSHHQPQVMPSQSASQTNLSLQKEAVIVSSERSTETKTGVGEGTGLPWPSPFKIPTHKFRKALKEALEAEKVLNKTLKQYLLDTLYDEITKYTFYPSPIQYQEVAESLLQGYPYLRFGLEHVEALTFWKTILSNKMRNGRKRVAKDEPVVAQRKRRLTSSSQGGHQMGGFGDCAWELMDFILPHSMEDGSEGDKDSVVKAEISSPLKPRKLQGNSQTSRKGPT